MKYPKSMRLALIAAALGAGGIFAQNATPPAPTDPAPVVSDVGPPPASERNSMGAIVLDDSLRPQRSSRTGVASVGRRELRERMRAQAQAELAQARAAEAAELRQRGAGALTEN
jgi:hypothetical protein